MRDRPRVVVLGDVCIEDELGRRVSRPGRRSELVFAYLAAEHDRTVTRDELADALWPDLLPDTWAAALRGVVSEVRQWVHEAGWEPTAVLGRAEGGYRLRLPPGVTVDVGEADEAIASARAALSAGQAEAGARDAARAAELARLPFLPHHEGEWVEGVRRHLADTRNTALELLVSAHWQSGDLRAAAKAAEQFVLADPFNEAAHRMRIEVHGAAGDRAGAQRAFEHCKGVLADGLGVAVSDQTKAALGGALRAGGRATPPPTEPLDLRVLVVEDHDFQRRTAVTLLRRLGVSHVTEAGDGASALELLATSPRTDVIVCDLDMPGMDGLAFIRNVAARRLAGSVIIASGLDRGVLESVRAVSESDGLQVLGAVEKPLTAVTLTDLLTSYRRRNGAPTHPAAIAVEDVLTAIDRGTVGARFRPIIDLGAGRLDALEVLPAWRHEQLGSVRRGQYQSLLDATGASHRLTDLLADLAGKAWDSLRGDGFDLRLLLCLPESELHDEFLGDRLAGTLDAHGMPVSSLTCLVDEQVLRRGSADHLAVLTRLRIKGFGLSADGVGRGRAELPRAPLSELRLAPELLAEATAGGDPARLEAALAGRHDLPLIVTGCDSAAAFDLLLSLGCRYAQGRVLGAPMSAGRVAGWAAGWEPPAPGSEA